MATAAGDWRNALRWLDRTWRLTPRDPTVALALAAACLGHNDSRAEALFAGVVAEHDVREAWLGLATARRRLGDTCGAAEALAEVRRRYVVGEDAAAIAEANSIPKAARDASDRPTPTVGCVRGQDGGLVGWAWHPRDPARDPVLTIQPAWRPAYRDRRRLRRAGIGGRIGRAAAARPDNPHSTSEEPGIPYECE